MCVMHAVTNPIETVAKAPIERRTIIIGNVNVIASATLAYAGHVSRMMSPATTAMASQAASPVTTPMKFLAISALSIERTDHALPGPSRPV